MYKAIYGNETNSNVNSKEPVKESTKPTPETANNGIDLSKYPPRDGMTLVLKDGVVGYIPTANVSKLPKGSKVLR
jgi:hypothetical protein